MPFDEKRGGRKGLPTAMQPNEQAILTAILQYLVSMHLRPVHHRNTGAIFHRGGQVVFGRSRSSINQKGAPDILVTFLGVGLAIEVKAAKGRLSPEQREWLNDFQAEPSRGLAMVARSVDDVVDALGRMRRGERWSIDFFTDSVSVGEKRFPRGIDTMTQKT